MRAGCGALLVVAAIGLTGCGPTTSSGSPTGVDNLTIPTPDPRQSDFVAEIDNPWLPLPVGATRTYRVEPTALTRVVRVVEGPMVDGVRTVRVSTQEQTAGRVGARLTRLPDDYYAQDRGGNVWWFGREGVWQAGVNGAEAGLAMAAEPRVGDGYRLAGTPGDDQVGEVLAYGHQVEVEGLLYADVVAIRTTSDGVGGPDGESGEVIEEEIYARGVGLVKRSGADGGLGLLDHQEPQG